jgi:integrase
MPGKSVKLWHRNPGGRGVPGPLDAGPFAADIASFRLHPAAENKAAATIRTYAGAACWFAACHLLAEAGKTRWEQVEAADVRRWMVWLLGRCCRGNSFEDRVYQMLDRRAEEAGYDPHAVHPHMFRHTFANDWQMGRIASDATFPGKRDHEAVGA